MRKLRETYVQRLQDVKEAMTGEEQLRGKSEAGAPCGVGR